MLENIIINHLKLYQKKKQFHAMKNDIWCLGVVLFMLTIGCAPWKKADINDEHFKKIMNGKMMDVIQKWGRNKYINGSIVDLLNKIFQNEETRISMSDLKQHPWLK
eukprot:712422_1